MDFWKAYVLFLRYFVAKKKAIEENIELFFFFVLNYYKTVFATALCISKLKTHTFAATAMFDRLLPKVWIKIPASGIQFEELCVEHVLKNRAVRRVY